MTFDPTLGAFIRSVRIRRELSQQRAADKARVSRRQWVFLEQGGNVTIEFLAKACAALDLHEVPISGGTVSIVQTPAVGDAMRLLAVGEAIAAQIEVLRDIAASMVIPRSSEGAGHAAAVNDFFAQHAEPGPEEADRIGRALRRLAADVLQPPEPSAPESTRRNRKVKREA